MRLFVSKILMFLLILLMLIQPVQARTYTEIRDDALVCMEATQKIEKEYNIKEHLLSTISNVETGRWSTKHQRMVAWPWTINVQGKGYFFETKAEAVREVKRLRASGIKSIDVGCMQINLAFHPKAFKSIEEAFSPKKNVAYGARFLKKLYVQKDHDWIKAAMAYHSSVPRKAQIYKKRLASAYENVKEAYNDSSFMFGKKEQNATKALASDIVYAKNKIKIEQMTATKANAWRQAKLKEYRNSKRR